MSEASQPRRLPHPVQLIVAFALIAALPSALLSAAALVGLTDAAGDVDPALRLACLLVGVVAFLVFAALQPPAPLRPLRAVATLKAYGPFAAAWLLFTVLYLRAASWLGEPVAVQALLRDAADHGVTTATLPGIAGGVLLAPVVEELAFRGYLLGALLAAMPSWAAQVLTAAAFGLVHGPGYALPLGALGLLLGWLRVRHGALLPAMLAHAVHNALVFGVAIAWPQTLEWMYPT